MRRVFIFAVLITFVFAGGFNVFASGVRDEFFKSGEIILLHTNDIFGAVLPDDGGLVNSAAYIRTIKAGNPNVLLLDAGNFTTENALSTNFSIVLDTFAFNITGYDAVVFGDNEFSGPLERIRRQIALAEFPFVSSNIKTTDGGFLGGNQYIVKKYNDILIGIFGITTLRTLNTATPHRSLAFINEIEAAREVVEILRNREKADIVIGITHMGHIKEDPGHITSPELAAAVPGIDIIIDGRSRVFLDAPLQIGSTRIVSTDGKGRHVGYGRMIVDGGILTGFEWKPVVVDPDVE